MTEGVLVDPVKGAYQNKKNGAFLGDFVPKNEAA
jgi:hypothetical protein